MRRYLKNKPTTDTAVKKPTILSKQTGRRRDRWARKTYCRRFIEEKEEGYNELIDATTF
jgi:hypothetical protein